MGTPRKTPPPKKKKRAPAPPAPPRIPTAKLGPEPEGAEGFGNDGLTIRQRLFVAALLGPAAGNQTRAAEMAGYRAENRNSLISTASENLTKPNVQAALAHAWALKLASPEWAKASLMDLASSSMANFLSPDGKGGLQLDMMKGAERGALGQLKEYSQESVDMGDGPEVLKQKIRIHDRGRSLETLLKFYGILVERHEHTVRGGVEGDMSDENLVWYYLACKRPKSSWLPGVLTRYEQGKIKPTKPASVPGAAPSEGDGS